MPASDDALLAGLTVLDFTRVLAGPYCTRLLADLGARVIKVERPGEGDDTRRGHVQIEEGRTDQATYFIRINAGKSSLALDLAHPKAREVVLDLAHAADVVVENFLPGVVAKLGCDYATLTSVRRDLVYCSISGFGQTGPLSLQPAFHHIINAMSGVMHLEQQDDPAPRPGYLQAADVLAGTHAFGAILAALWRRTRTGKGGHLDVSMLECLVAAEDINYGGMLNASAEYPGPRPGMVVHGIGGRHVAMQTVGAPQLWARLVAMMDRPQLAADPRFATPAARREHWAELHPILCEWLRPGKTGRGGGGGWRRSGRRGSPPPPCSRPPRLSLTRTWPSVRRFPSSTTPGAAPCGSRPCPFTSTTGPWRRAERRRTASASTRARSSARCWVTPGSGSRSYRGSRRCRRAQRGRVP